MTRATLYARTSALPAIAAALALLSTPTLAQTTQPTEPATGTSTPTAQPTPDTQTAPAPTDSGATTTAAPAGTKTAAAKPKATRTTTVKRAAAPATAAVHKAARAAPAQAAAKAPPAVKPAAPPTAAAALAATPAAQAAAAKPAAPRPADNALLHNDTALELGGGALAILALGGAALAMARSRRRKREDEEYYSETAYAEPAPAPDPVMERSAPRHDEPVSGGRPSGFAWGNEARREEHAEASSGDDRKPGESWVERAYRGPTADNPSLSLKKRLKRAAFFDKREQEVAEHRASPVDADAGLPESAQLDERQLADA